MDNGKATNEANIRQAVVQVAVDRQLAAAQETIDNSDSEKDYMLTNDCKQHNKNMKDKADKYK